MRNFSDVERELSLKRIIAGRLYSFYVSGNLSHRPMQAAERFEGVIPPELTPRYVELLRALQLWVEQHLTLARLVRFEQPTEVGQDFVLRPHHVYTTSIDSYADAELDIEPPPEFAQMQDATKLALRGGRGALSAPRFSIIEGVVSRSLLTPTHFTYFDDQENRFIVVAPELEERDLTNW